MTTTTRTPELDPEKIFRAADQKRRGLRITWAAVRRQAGFSPAKGRNVFTRLGQGHLPDTHNTVLVLLWIGLTDVRSFLKDQRDV